MTTGQPEDVKPCPFCGGEARLTCGGVDDPRRFVECRQTFCQAEGPRKITWLEAAHAWNRRVASPIDNLKDSVIESARKWAKYNPKQEGECGNSDDNWLRMALTALEATEKT